MARIPDWQNNLTRLIEANRETAFDFPTWNCLVWAYKGIEAVTGNDLTGDWLGKYKDELSAARLMRRLRKVKTSQSVIAKDLESDLKPISFARPGDIVFTDGDHPNLELPQDEEFFGPTPGICYGHISFFVGEHGLIQIETLQLGSAIWVF